MTRTKKKYVSQFFVLGKRTKEKNEPSSLIQFHDQQEALKNVYAQSQVRSLLPEGLSLYPQAEYEETKSARYTYYAVPEVLVIEKNICLFLFSRMLHWPLKRMLEKRTAHFSGGGNLGKFRVVSYQEVLSCVC